MFSQTFRNLKMTQRILRQSCSKCSTVVVKEYEVPTFCDLHVNLPYRVHVKPLNVHKYHNCDKLIVQLNKECEKSFEYDLYGNRVSITDQIERNDIVCKIKAPVKANLYITSKRDITVGYFHGDKLHLESNCGDITVDRYQGDEVDIKVHKGNINLLEFIQAANIRVLVVEQGDVYTGRLQSLRTEIEVKNGNVSIESCYANESKIIIDKGHLELNNGHKFCNIFIKNGTKTITGFDGKLNSTIKDGPAKVHISRLIQDSKINVLNGNLDLKLSEICQEYVQVNVISNELNLGDNTKYSLKKTDEAFLLVPENDEENNLFVKCNGRVKVESASWQDMMKLKLKK